MLAVREGGETLVSRYALSLVPSAGMWLGWRARGTMPMDRLVMLLADPVLGPEAQDAAAEVSAWRDDGEASLRPLPRARDEVRDIADRVGPLALVFEGAEATEARVLDIARGAGVVHLATHTVLDSRHPERAALVLAPGPEHEGLVYVREIASHPLGDAVVVLAACRGADGLVLRGEGLMGLVRGYLQAGARAVVASRWPLSDVRAARFFVAFYDELATGASVSDALAQTQRRWIEQGGSPEIWAGLMVVGDGSARPLSPRPEPVDPWRVIGWLLCIAGRTRAICMSSLLPRKTRKRIASRPPTGSLHPTTESRG